MNQPAGFMGRVFAGMCVLATLPYWSTYASAEEKSNVEVLTSGPIHEAFAPVVSFSPEAGVVATKEPPAEIDETPPSQRPAGDNVAWIPGYWGWDADRDDYVWVTGVWRTIPPGRQWVPGYWSQGDQGYQWVSGYWGDAEASDIDYLPAPPAPTEEQIGDPPSDDQMWIPGSWVYDNGDYAWRPGYWMQGNANWNWNPGYYVWSPRGYLFVNGYWDYYPARRGLVFAPVYFNSQSTRPGFAFSPSVVVSLAVFGTSLFVNPGYGHYYYGNYYGPSYANAGFSPWFAYSARSGTGYDPFFAGQRWQNRTNAGWERQLQTRFDQRASSAPAGGARPGAKANAGEQTTIPLEQLAKSSDNGGVKLQPVSTKEHQQIAQTSRQVRELGHERLRAESKGASDTKAEGATTAKVAKSPIVGKTDAGAKGSAAPPPPPETPKPDPSVTKPATSEAGAETKDGKPKTAAPKNATPRPGTPGAAGSKTNPPGDSPKTESKPKPESKPEPKPEPKPAPKPEAKPEPRPAPKPEAKPQPKPEPKPAPKPEAKPEPKPAPKPEAKPQPKPETKPAPKPEPQPETKPAPKPKS